MSNSFVEVSCLRSFLTPSHVITIDRLIGEDGFTSSLGVSVVFRHSYMIMLDVQFPSDAIEEAGRLFDSLVHVVA